MKLGAEGVAELNRNSPELSLVKPDAFATYYPPKLFLPGLEREIRRIGGDQIERASAYGSVVNGDATKTSLMDLFVIVKNGFIFYDNAAATGMINLGTTKDSGFHALWLQEKANFHTGEIVVGNRKRGIKLWVMDHGELLKHARGGRPGAEGGKGALYVAGRLQKAMISTIYEETTPKEKREIDLAINQARIDGVWLALGLTPRYFDFDQLAGTYVNLSYAADKRVEKANKSRILLDRNYGNYQQMLDPILRCFEENRIISRIEGKLGLFEKIMSPSEEGVRKFLKESASHAFRVNFLQNIWTMGPLNGLGYGIAKVLRARSK